MIQYPEKYKRLLDPNEEVLWHGIREKRNNDYSYIVATMTLIGAALMIAVLVHTKEPQFAFLSVFLIIAAITSFANYDKEVHYLVTNNRVINDSNPKSKFEISSVSYKNIHRVKKKTILGEKTIVFQMHSDSVEARSDDGSYPNAFRRIANIDEVFEIIRNAWIEKSPYKQLSDTMVKAAEKHGLEVQPFHHIDSKVLKITDDLDGMLVDLRLNRLHDLGHYTITIVCPNPEDNFLGISREGFGTGFSKLMGTQDLQIGDKRFDDRFLLQSDNEHFFQKVMTDKVQKLMMDASMSLDWTLVFGRRKVKSEQKTSKKDTIEGILDAHLMDENPDVVQRQEGLESRLEFTCKNVTRNTSHQGVISKKCATALEMMIELAKNIQAYEYAA